MGNPFRVVLVCLTLAAATEVSAQQAVVYSVDGWPRMGTRADGKLEAEYFQFGVQQSAPTGPGAPAGRVNVQDGVLEVPIGAPVFQFMRAALLGERMKSVLIEFPMVKEGGKGPAPFAARLSEVVVTGVRLSKSGFVGGSGYAAVSLQAQKIEVFSAVQDPSGKVGPVNRFGYDVRAGKTF